MNNHFVQLQKKLQPNWTSLNSSVSWNPHFLRCGFAGHRQFLIFQSNCHFYRLFVQQKRSYNYTLCIQCH